jgi:hypothetical protein
VVCVFVVFMSSLLPYASLHPSQVQGAVDEATELIVNSMAVTTAGVNGFIVGGCGYSMLSLNASVFAGITASTSLHGMSKASFFAAFDGRYGGVPTTTVFAFFQTRTRFASNIVPTNSVLIRVLVYLCVPPSTDLTRAKESKGLRARLAANIKSNGYTAVWYHRQVFTDYPREEYQPTKAIHWLKVSVPAKPVRGKKRGMGEISSASGMAQQI